MQEKKELNTYCVLAKKLPSNDLNRIYHDTQYGFPLICDNELFGRLILEINQAGLSWKTILNKKDNFRRFYSNFNVKEIAKYKGNLKNFLTKSAIHSLKQKYD